MKIINFRMEFYINKGLSNTLFYSLRYDRVWSQFWEISLTEEKLMNYENILRNIILYTRTHSSIIHKSQKMEATQMSIDRWADKQNVV